MAIPVGWETDDAPAAEGDDVPDTFLERFAV
jgi:hypothetical protein